LAFVRAAAAEAASSGDVAGQLGLSVDSVAADLFRVFAPGSSLLGAAGGATGALGVTAMANGLQSKLTLFAPSRDERDEPLLPWLFVGKTGLLERYFAEKKKRKSKTVGLGKSGKLQVIKPEGEAGKIKSVMELWTCCERLAEYAVASGR
jgi:hypothetical protein